jgi:hypothetical protein
MARYEPGAVYELEVIEQAFNETANGNPRIELECGVKYKVRAHGTPEVHLAPPEASQYSVRVGLVFATEKQREMNLKKLRFAGWEGDSFDTFDMVGRTIRCVCEHVQGTGKNSGKVYDNFDLLMPPMENQDMDNKPVIRKKLNALLGKSLKETGFPSGGQSTSQRPPASHTTTQPPSRMQDDDGTPF